MRYHCICILLICIGCVSHHPASREGRFSPFKREITATLRKQVLQEAEWAMQQEPMTVTAAALLT